MTLYEGLQEFDDREARAQITYTRLCFAGPADEIQYGKNCDDTLVSLAELEALGRDVCAGGP
jgi:hypothetical protein